MLPLQRVKRVFNHYKLHPQIATCNISPSTCNGFLLSTLQENLYRVTLASGAVQPNFDWAGWWPKMSFESYLVRKFLHFGSSDRLRMHLPALQLSVELPFFLLPFVMAVFLYLSFDHGHFLKIIWGRGGGSSPCGSATIMLQDQPIITKYDTEFFRKLRVSSYQIFISEGRLGNHVVRSP